VKQPRDHASRTAVAGARGAADGPYHDLRDRGRWRCDHAPAVIAGHGIAARKADARRGEPEVRFASHAEAFRFDGEFV
jgi:hypothetical protein